MVSVNVGAAGRTRNSPPNGPTKGVTSGDQSSDIVSDVNPENFVINANQATTDLSKWAKLLVLTQKRTKLVFRNSANAEWVGKTVTQIVHSAEMLPNATCAQVTLKVASGITVGTIGAKAKKAKNTETAKTEKSKKATNAINAKKVTSKKEASQVVTKLENSQVLFYQK